MNQELINQINGRPGKAYIAATGAGATFIGDFAIVPGASKTILGFNFPYEQQLFNEFIQGKPDSYASAEAARKLAVASFVKASKTVPLHEAIGIGCACSIATLNERPGREHKINVALHLFNKTISWSLTLAQGMSRELEEEMAAELIVKALCLAKNIPFDITKHPANLIKVANESAPVNDDCVSLVNGGDAEFIYFGEDKKFEEQEVVVFPGSFNPLHDGHIKMFEHAQQHLGIKPMLEVTAKNADKPPLDFIDIYHRIKLLSRYGLLLTRAPKMIDKLNVLLVGVKAKRVTFIVGADTWKRIFDPRFLSAGEIEAFRNTNTKFMVFGRDAQNSSAIPTEFFNQVKDLVIETDYSKNFNNTFRSSDIRKNVGEN